MNNIFVFPVVEEEVEGEDRDPPNVEIVDEEHVEDKILDGAGRLGPANHSQVRILDSCYCASLGQEIFDPEGAHSSRLTAVNNEAKRTCNTSLESSFISSLIG